MERDFERWPRYKELYIRAFDKMLKTHPATEEALKNLNKPPVGGGGETSQQSSTSTSGSISRTDLEGSDSGRQHDDLAESVRFTGGGGGFNPPRRTSNYGCKITDEDPGRSYAQMDRDINEPRTVLPERAIEWWMSLMSREGSILKHEKNQGDH